MTNSWTLITGAHGCCYLQSECLKWRLLSPPLNRARQAVNLPVRVQFQPRGRALQIKMVQPQCLPNITFVVSDQASIDSGSMSQSSEEIERKLLQLTQRPLKAIKVGLAESENYSPAGSDLWGRNVHKFYRISNYVFHWRAFYPICQTVQIETSVLVISFLYTKSENSSLIISTII